MSGFYLGEEWRMSIAHIKAVMENPHFTSSENGVLLSLAYHANGANEAFPKLSTIEHESGLARKTIKTALRALEKCGCLTTKLRPPKPSLYTLQQSEITSHQRGKSTPVKLPRSTSVELPLKQGQLTPNIEGNRNLTVIRNTPKKQERKVFAGLDILREIPGWYERGEPHLKSLSKWVTDKAWSAEDLERSAIGLSSVQTKTLKGYASMASAFQRRLSMGYDRNGTPQSNGQRPRQSLDGPDRLETMKKARREAMQQ
jgi:hypothetical protein